MAQSAAAARERHGIAIRVADGRPYSADRICDIEGYVDGEAWRCSGPRCSACMVPCAWEPEGKDDGSPYKRAPYFRSVDAQEHVPGCRPLEYLEVGGRGGEPHYHQGPAHEPPNRVRFCDEAPAPAPYTVPDVVPATGSSGGWGSQDAPQRRIWETSVPTIGPVCDAYVETVLHHARPLRVDGCGGRSYGEVVRPLPPRGLDDAERRIFYGQIHVRRLADALRAVGDGDRLEIPLWNVGGRWRVLDVRMAEWGADREIFLDRLRELVRRGQGGAGLRFAAGRVAVAFFIGEARQWRRPPFRVDRFCAVHVVWADTWLPCLSGEPPRLQRGNQGENARRSG